MISQRQAFYFFLLTFLIVLFTYFMKKQEIISYQSIIPNCKVNQRIESLSAQVDIMQFLFTLREREKKIFSQNGEDGIIEALFERVNTTNKYYVEFGAQNGHECNTRYLRETKGWQGLTMDGGFENAAINFRKEFVFWSNIKELFLKYKVPLSFDLLSIDTDFKDFWILRELLLAGYRPRVIVMEINTFVGSNDAITVPKNSNQTVWDGSQFFGFSISAAYVLGRRFGYSLVYCENFGVNCFAVLDEIVGNQVRISDFIFPKMIFRKPAFFHPYDKKKKTWHTVKLSEI